MEFIQVEGTNELLIALTLALNSALVKKEAVLWIVTGGSNISVCVKVMAALVPDNLKNLTIVLSDERFGPPGHTDSNFFQLYKQGFEERGAKFVDILEGSSFGETLARGNMAAEASFVQAKTIIGFFGMGSDGHIAGILPHSPAAVSDETWMIGYDGGQFQRITLTPFAFSHVQQAFIGAFGPEKLGPLTTLRDQMLPILDQPAQILRHIPEVSIFNDQIGEIKL